MASMLRIPIFVTTDTFVPGEQYFCQIIMVLTPNIIRWLIHGYMYVVYYECGLL